MAMKKKSIYTAPSVEMELIPVEQLLTANTGVGNGDPDDVSFSKKHDWDHSWGDLWDDSYFDDGNAGDPSSLPRQKSVWDD